MELEPIQSSSKVIASLSLTPSHSFSVFLVYSLFLKCLSCFSCLSHVSTSTWDEKNRYEQSFNFIIRYIERLLFPPTILGKNYAWVTSQSQFIFLDSVADETRIILIFWQIFVSKRKISADCLCTQLRCTAMPPCPVSSQKDFHEYTQNVTNSYVWGQFLYLSLWGLLLPKLRFFPRPGKIVSYYLFVI